MSVLFRNRIKLKYWKYWKAVSMLAGFKIHIVVLNSIYWSTWILVKMDVAIFWYWMTIPISCGKEYVVVFYTVKCRRNSLISNRIRNMYLTIRLTSLVLFFRWNEHNCNTLNPVIFAWSFKIVHFIFSKFWKWSRPVVRIEYFAITAY